METISNSRRKFLKYSTVTGLGLGMTTGMPAHIFAGNSKEVATPAILGGEKIRKKAWPGWPVWIPETDEELVLKVLRSGVWSRSRIVEEFEEKWAKMMGSKRCLTTVNGTNALICAIRNLDIGGGDEVITSPFTFISTPLSILQNGAMPIFADIDPETRQIDPAKIEEKITPRTRAILPVHINGQPADMERIMAIARKHNLLVVEDACQAWLAEVNHKKVGTFGEAGCYSFQNSKHVPMGEGGAIVSDDEKYMDRCNAYHNLGGMKIAGTKIRLTEYQAAIGLVQMKRLEEETTLRNENSDYLRDRLKNFPGIIPHKLYSHVTRVAMHAFPVTYIKEEFNGLSRANFMKALSAEGIPNAVGYTEGLHDLPYLKDAFESKNFKKMYPPEMLNFERYVEQNRCPETDKICKETNVRFSQNMFLGSKSDVDDIVRAMEKIHANAALLKSRLE